MKVIDDFFWLSVVGLAGFTGLTTGCTIRLRSAMPQETTSSHTEPHQLAVDLLAGLTDAGGLYLDGIGAAARFNTPYGIASDGTNLYISDEGNFTIRKMVLSTGAVSTLSGTPGIQGYPFITNGTASSSTFSLTTGLTYSGGYLYLADEAVGKIRKISVVDGSTSTLAGSGSPIEADSSDGAGDTAAFYFPDALTTDGNYLYVADLYGNTIRQVTISTGDTVTLAGSLSFPPVTGSSDGTGSAASFSQPEAIAIDSTHTNLYVGDTSNCTIRKIVISSGATTTIAGNHGSCSVVDSTDGTGATARFAAIFGLYADASDLYIADGNYLRKMDLLTGNTVTFAGNSGIRGTSDSTDGTGNTASFSPMGSITEAGGSLYLPTAVAGGPIRKVSPTNGDTVTVAGLAIGGTSDSTDGTGATARFENPLAIVADETYAYVADYLAPAFSIRKINISTGATTTLAGSLSSSGVGSGDSTDGTGATAAFGGIAGAVNDGILLTGGFLYFADAGKESIRKIDPVTGNTTTLAGTPGTSGFANSTDGTGATARFSLPSGIASDGDFIYLADTANNRIRKIALSTGDTTTLAGQTSTGHADSTDGTGSTATFTNPKYLTIQGNSLFVTDGYAIRQVNLVTGNTTTFAGNATTSGKVDGIGTASRFSSFAGLTTDGTYLYVSDSGLIREINLATAATGTYLGPNGVINLATGNMPSVQGLFWGVQGLFFTNFYSAVYRIH